MTFLGLLAVGAGAAVGAWLRWGLGMLLNPVFPTLPFGTLAANLVGGYLMGIALGVFDNFQVAGDLTVEVEFLLSNEDADRLLELVRNEGVRVFYGKAEADFGTTEGKDQQRTG